MFNEHRMIVVNDQYGNKVNIFYILSISIVFSLSEHLNTESNSTLLLDSLLLPKISLALLISIVDSSYSLKNCKTSYSFSGLGT